MVSPKSKVIPVTNFVTIPVYLLFFNTITIKVWYPGLQKLDVSGTCLVAYQGSGEQSYHPSSVSHYGNTALLNKLRQVSDKFIEKFPETIKKSFDTYYADREREGFIKEVNHAIEDYSIEQQRHYYRSNIGLSNFILNYENPKREDFEGKSFQEYQHNIYVNDMSLPWGGDFKTGNNIAEKAGHGTHKWGEEVDINFRRLKYNVGGQENKAAEKERMILEKVLEDVFGMNKIWFENGDHWHCTVGSSTFEKPKYRDKLKVKREDVENY